MSEQGTDAWRRDRLGKVTASRVADVVARIKSGWGSSRANYAAQLIVERLTGEPQDNYTNAAMQRGIDLEPQARTAYQFWTDAEVTEVGFVPHPTIAMAGASPDGLVGDDGLVEIKVPNSATHIDTLLRRKPDEKYITQMMFQMACTGRSWCDFVSYDPRLPEHMQLFVKRVHRDNEQIAMLEKEATIFLVEVEAKLANLAKAYPEQPEASVLPKPEKERRRWDELPPSQQAAIRCGEPSFRKFLAEQTGAIAAWTMADAAVVVRHRCDVSTRAMIKPGTEAAQRWHDLEKEYQAWLSVPAA
jgi:putative phage-type endonuclease